MLPQLKSVATVALALNGFFSASASASVVSQIPDGQLQAASGSATTSLSCPTASSSSAPAESSPVFHNEADKNGAVASESAVCSQIGIDLLKAGGNAADAMVGTVLCVGVTAMYHSGYVSCFGVTAKMNVF